MLLPPPLLREHVGAGSAAFPETRDGSVGGARSTCYAKANSAKSFWRLRPMSSNGAFLSSR